MCIQTGKCCKCIPLGALIITIGIFSLLEFLISMREFNPLVMMLPFVNFILLALLLCFKKSVFYRRITFIGYFVSSILEILALVALSILFLTLFTPR